MGSAVKETLKSLCCSYGWSYGVLWQFDQQNPMFLTLSDAYEDRMRGLIDDMLLQVHILGQGIVGEAAFTGKDQWIFSDGHCQDESLMGSVSYEDDEACSEFHDQCEFGIKTIVAIPLDSHGVVQFGSTKKIPESLEFSNQAKKLLLENINIQQLTASGGNYGSDEWLDSLLAEGLSACRNQEPRISDTSDEPIGEICDALNISHSQASVSKMRHETVETLCADPDAVLSDMMSLEQLAAETAPGSPLVFTPFLATPITCDGASPNFQDDSQFASAYSIEDLLDVENSMQVNSGNDVFRWPVVPSDSRAMHVNSGNYVPTSLCLKICGADTPFNCQAPPVLNATNALSQNTPAKLSNPISCLAQDFESSRGLTPLLQSCPPTVISCMSGISELDAIYSSRPRKGLFSELGLERLLSGTVPTDRCSYDDDPQSTSKRRKIVSSSSSGSQIQSEVYSCLSEKISSFQHQLKVATPENLGSQRDFTLKPQAGMWIDDRHSINGGSNNLTLPKRALENTKPVKKRAKPGESTRPRPKDRQQFQDRLCDLRKMIPNTGKLSIDALLDSTIKHLIFLQNVTNYAEKLKRIADQKEKGVSSKNNANGVTWAWELSDQAMICPIKVEDVGSSGEMLIEMLCDDGVSFLEIADTIRGFGLRILTGSMEDRNEKTWARYIVEAETSGSATRVDVFWSLAQHLQRTTTSGINTVSQLPLKATCHQQNLPQPISADTRR